MLLILAYVCFVASGLAGAAQLYPVVAPLVSRLFVHTFKPKVDPEMSFTSLAALFAVFQSIVKELPTLIADIKALIAEVHAAFPVATPADHAAAATMIASLTPSDVTSPAKTPGPPAAD